MSRALSCLLAAASLPGCLSHLPTVEPEPAAASAVAVDGSLVCAIDDAHAVRCRGVYEGFVHSRLHPIEDPSVPLALPEARALDASADHACAATIDGQVWCWGFATHGQLGVPRESPDEGEAFHATPVRVEDIDDAIDVAVGRLFSCALRATGEVACWGLFDGLTGAMSPEIARTIPGIVDAIEIEAGSSTVCARTAERRVFCAGDGAYDVLGPSPTGEVGEIVGLPADVIDLALAGYSGVALDARGGIWNWGMVLPHRSGDRGESFAHRPRPERIGELSGAREIVAHDLRGGTVCGLREEGSLACWGENDTAQLGRGYAETAMLESISAPPFEESAALPRLDAVALGGGRSCGIRRADRGLVCWGSDADGALLGGGTFHGLEEPARALEGARDLAAGLVHACAIDREGAVVCWGEGSDGRLGGGNAHSSTAPQRVPGIARASMLALGMESSCALTERGEVLCWGSGRGGVARGDGTDSDAHSPTRIALPGPARTISAGFRHACAIVDVEAGARVACWGSNELGLIGDERFDELRPPTVIESFGEALDVEVGNAATCAVVEAGVLCLGDRRETAIGVPREWDEIARERVRNGQYRQEYVLTDPVLVPGTAGARGLEIEGLRACAWVGARSVCWGGELGEPRAYDGNELRPVARVIADAESDLGFALCSLESEDACIDIDGAPLTGLLPRGDLTKIAIGSSFSCGLSIDAEVRCWAEGRHGQLGDGRAFALEPLPLRFE